MGVAKSREQTLRFHEGCGEESFSPRQVFFLDYQSYLNSNIGYVFINLSHSLDGKPLLGASSDLVSVRRGPGD